MLVPTKELIVVRSSTESLDLLKVGPMVSRQTQAVEVVEEHISMQPRQFGVGVRVLLELF
jgi:hypothetical protein